MASVEALSCPICTNLVENNRECNACGTLYCYECIKEWSERNPSCPQCRKSIIIKDQNDSSSFAFNRFVERTVNDLEVDCPNQCSQKKVKRGNLKDHLERLCENISKPCDMAKYGCLYCGKITDLQKHYEECSYYKVRHILEKYELQVLELTSKLSTLEQRNAMLGLDNEELKDKVRKLNAQLQKQPTPSHTTPSNNSTQNTSSGTGYQQQQQQQNRFSSPTGGSSHQQNNYQNNNANYQNYSNNRSNVNSNPGNNPFSSNYQSYNNNSNYSHQQNQNNRNNNGNAHQHDRRGSKKSECKQQ
ncbi:hypothetical protein NAEGRDRAFT_78521 [Naegleria gruberi]|uniref:RING-type domain-containing protein n=1 Tax=Naegleria gruberi TaxID=5762 RepID=D2V4C7_NAEGR|nr:uncharacterized protein NAEGRDRAFT_78521 [Naegleria gruberi]EFC48494.1 hypothetical protein NAEGRDRAFT_78521 [Naegleria gruberi]|eukprot:XP_002681238.1 hypothetical protein NAEGRDRAFT_78521 [Naegleria gruberi strain NEG-M]